MQVGAQVSGLSRVEQTFKNLPRATQNKAARQSLRVGAYVVRDQASANVKSITSDEASGLLAKSIRVYSLRKYRGMLRVAVMIKRALVTSKGVRVGLYGSVLEYGKAGQPPRSWIRSAAKEKEYGAFLAVLNDFRKRIPDVVRAAKQ